MVLPYKLEYHGSVLSRLSTPLNISKYVVSIDKFTDVGSGEIVSAKLMLDSRLGDFITETNAGMTPIIKQYDILRLEITELKTPTSANEPKYVRYLIVDDVIPLVNTQGQFLELELFGRERYLQKMLFPGHFYFISFKDMAKRIIDFYNANKGTNQPTITIDVSQMSDHTYGIFDFSKETTCYDALMEVVNRCTLPVPAGGEGEYFGLVTLGDTFAPIDGPSGAVQMRLAPQGYTPTGESVVQLTKPMQLTEVKEPSKASIVVVEGKPGSASMPPEPAMYRSYIEEYTNIPVWRADVEYKAGSLVRYADVNNLIYVWKRDPPTPNVSGDKPTTANTHWGEVTLEQYIADQGESGFVYSPWTKGKVGAFRNYCGNPQGEFYTESATIQQRDKTVIPDCNLVVRESNPGQAGQIGLWRDSVDFRLSTLTNAILDRYLYASTSRVNTRVGRQYEGLRILCDGEPPTALDDSFAQQFFANGKWKTDQFGVTYRNAFVTYDEKGRWIVFRTTERYDECVVFEEGKTFLYNKTYRDSTNKDLETQSGDHFKVVDTSTGDTGFAWRDDGGTFLGNDVFHYPANIRQQDGLYKLHGTIDTGSLSSNSAIEIEYLLNPKSLEGTQTGDDQEGIVEQLGNFFGWLTTNEETTDGKFDLLKNIINKLSTAIGWAGDIVYDALYNWSRGAHMNNSGWWAMLFAPPFPRTTDHHQTVGSLFGGDAENQVSVLDLRNLNYTPTGKTGYAADDAYNLGQISGIKLLMNFNIYGWNIEMVRGNIPFRCWLETTRGDIMVCDKNLRFQGITQLLDFPITQFKQYRGRIPIALTGANIVSRVLNPELSVTEIFERRKIKRIGLQCLLAYDDNGRYDPVNLWGLIRTFLSGFPDNTTKFNGRIDYLHFTKDAIVIAQNKTDNTYTKEAQATDIAKYHLADSHKRYPNISNIAQLQKIANSELDIENFSHDKWTATYMDEVRVKAERTVYLKDESLIDSNEIDSYTGSDFDAETDKEKAKYRNTRALIAKKITYSVGDRATNSAMKTTIDLYKKVIPRK